LWSYVGHAAKPQYEIKLATLAPENSSLVKIFKEMDAELRKETGGRVGFKIFSGFALGDERDVFRKLRIGLIQAATFSANFLNDLNPNIRVLQVPFLFNNYQEADHLLERIDADLKESFSRRGYRVLGWSEVGFIYMMATVPVASIEDLKGKKVWSTANSPMANAVFNRAEASPVTLGTPDVLVALQTNLLEVVYNSPYYALVTQWHTRIKYIVDLPLAYIGGALVISNKAYSRIPSQYHQTLESVCAKYLRRLVVKTRKDNEDALKIIYSRGVNKTKVEPIEIDRFKELLDKAMGDISSELLPRDYLKEVKAILKAYRTSTEEKQ
jgi:TRAP-type C4-dicarboxylate transport system substrate-binding protein